VALFRVKSANFDVPPRIEALEPALSARFFSRWLNEMPRQFSSALVDRGSQNAKSVQKLSEFPRDFIEEIPLRK
jgi:hypothetical protein